MKLGGSGSIPPVSVDITREEYNGDYDWNLRKWSGRIEGMYRRGYGHPLFSFRWTWEGSSESGWGFFEFDRSRQELRGGWALGPDRGDELGHSLETLQAVTTPWLFKRDGGEIVS